MTINATLHRRNRLRLRTAGILAALGLMVGLVAAQTASAWVKVSGIYVRMNANHTSQEYCNRTVQTVAEEYWLINPQYDPHGGVQAFAEFHVENENGYWKWDRTAWTPMGNFHYFEDSHVLYSDEVRLYFRHLDPTGRFWEYANAYEHTKPYETKESQYCHYQEWQAAHSTTYADWMP